MRGPQLAAISYTSSEISSEILKSCAILKSAIPRTRLCNTENNTDNKYSLLPPYLMYSTESNTDSKYPFLRPYLMYSTEYNTDS